MTVDPRPAGSQTTWLWFDQALLPEGWARSVRIGLRDGAIKAIQTSAAAEPGDEVHATGLPGLSNLHSHAFQRAMAGLAEVRGASPDSFWTWRDIMYRLVDRLSPDDLLSITAMAYAEMLEGGFTRVAEFHYLHHDLDGQPYDSPARMIEAIAAAAAETGLGLTLVPVFYAHSGFGGAAPSEGQRRFIHDLDGFHRLLDASRSALWHLPDPVLGLAAHSLRAVTPDELRVLPTMTDGPLHIHVAEQVREVEDCLAWSGRRPVDLLSDTVEIDRRWCLIHATHMTDSETRRLAASGAVAGLCPITEANLGDGIFPAAAYAAAGGAWGIGSDSNVLIDAAQELRMLEYSQRLAERSRNVMADPAGGSTGAALFRAALAGGAQACGLSDGAGLAVGRTADIVALSGQGVASGDHRLDDWLFVARDRRVEAVWRRGEQVVRNGRHVAHAAIARRYAATMARLLDIGSA